MVEVLVRLAHFYTASLQQTRTVMSPDVLRQPGLESDHVLPRRFTKSPDMLHVALCTYVEALDQRRR